MSYRGYTESIEVLIDILDEIREIKELMKPKAEEITVQETKEKKVTQRRSSNANN